MKNFTYLQESLSTNDDVLHFLKVDEQKIVGCYTFHQKKGRGQYGNSWESEKNLNIAFSIAIPTNFVKISDSLFNFYTALLLRSFIAKLTNKKIEIKWPNDLILNQKKIAGLLIEKIKHHSQNYFIIGFGLNVLQSNFKNFPNASSLQLESPIKYDLDQISENIFQHLESQICELIYEKNILSEYETHLFRKDEISVFEIDNVRQNGIIKNIDAAGNLYVDLEVDGLRKFINKEIKLLY